MRDSRVKCRFKILIIGVLLLITGCGCQNIENKTTSFDVFDLDSFELINGVPYIVKGGMIYQHVKENEWIPIEREKNVVQLVSGEYLTGVYEDGTVFTDAELAIDEYMPLGSAHGIYMSGKMIEASQREPIQYIGELLGGSCIALGKNGDILYPHGDEYKILQIDELPIWISGQYILTECGNVFFVNIENDYLNCIYSGGDIVELDCGPLTGQAVGLKQDGTVISWLRRDGQKLNVEDWKDVVTVEAANYTVVGLTKKGKILYATNNKVNQEKIQAELSEWNDEKIIDFSLWGLTLSLISEDGYYYTVDLAR